MQTYPNPSVNQTPLLKAALARVGIPPSSPSGYAVAPRIKRQP